MWLQGWCSAHCYSIVFLILFLKGEFAVPPGTHGSDIKDYFPESFVFFGIQHRMLLQGIGRCGMGLMRCFLMLLKVVNRILEWLGRRVGCWIDASEFFFCFVFWRKKERMMLMCVMRYRFWESVSEISAQ